MKRYGAVVIFPAGMSNEAAGFALAKMAREGLIEDASRPPINDYKGKEMYPASNGVEEYDDDCGGPVWYVP